MSFTTDLEKTPMKNLKNIEVKEEYNCPESKVSINEVVEYTESIRSVDLAPMPTQSKSPDDIPDGGYGWFVVFAGFLVNFIVFGDSIVWGVYSNAYATMDLSVKGSTTELMAVGTIVICSINIFAPISPILFRFGYRFTLIIGNILMLVGLILASFSTSVWQLYLTQGLCFGLGGSIEYMTIASVIPQWFSKRRGIAFGLSSAGTGIGGLAMSPLANYLIHTYGIEWTYRTMGFLTVGINFIVVCLLRTRGEPEKENKRNLTSAFNFGVLKNTNFLIWSFGSGISVAGYLVPLFYIPKYCTSLGIDSSKSSVLVGVASASSAIGRFFLGFFADRIGRLNMFVIGSALSGLFCLLVWPFSYNFGSMLAFSILFGSTCGIYFVLAAPITAEIVGPNNINSGLSFLFITSAIVSTGPPISSQILEVGGFFGVQMFAGSVYLFGVLVSIFVKIRMSGSLFSSM